MSVAAERERRATPVGEPRCLVRPVVAQLVAEVAAPSSAIERRARPDSERSPEENLPAAD